VILSVEQSLSNVVGVKLSSRKHSSLIRSCSESTTARHKGRMARINKQGYIERKTCGSHSHRSRTKRTVDSLYRDWWLAKRNIEFKLFIPNRYFGKRVRFKVEVIEE